MNMLDNFNFKIYSQEEMQALAKALSKASVKAVKGNGTFEVIATTEGIDRDGEVIMVSGWDFGNFMKNPIMLWGHNYYEMEAIIGAVTEIIPQEKQVVVRGIFANSESGQEARQLYDDGILKAVSVGFIPKERVGNAITKAELLEISFVSVPCNPDAISLAKIHKLDGMMKTKTVEDEEEEIIVGIEEERTPPIEGQNNSEEPANAPTEEKAVCEVCKCQKSGRVLSAKNAELISSCIDMLIAVRDANQADKTVIVEAAKDAVLDAQSVQKFLERIISNVKILKNNS